MPQLNVKHADCTNRTYRNEQPVQNTTRKNDKTCQLYKRNMHTDKRARPEMGADCKKQNKRNAELAYDLTRQKQIGLGHATENENANTHHQGPSDQRKIGAERS